MKKLPHYPKVTFSIATYNGGQLLELCLSSIRNQEYPQNRIEILAIDDNSADNSVEIAKKYGAKVLTSGKRNMYISQRMGLHAATGDLFYLLDQDIELRDSSFIRKMIVPLQDNPDIIGSMTRAYPKKSQPWVTRYIPYQPFQCDPLFEYLTPSIEKSFVARKNGYYRCEFKLGSIPAESRVLYRMDVLKKTRNWKESEIYDHDLLINTIKDGYSTIAYVPDAGIFHHHASNLKSLVKKRMRNLTAHYFPQQDSLAYRWTDVGDKRQIVKLGLWVIYANLFFPAAIRGFLRFLKHRDPALLMEPIVTIATTDGILWTFLRQPKGRDIIKKLLNPFYTHKTGAFGK